MEHTERPTWSSKARGFLSTYKYVLLVAAVGLVLLCWPQSDSDSSGSEVSAEAKEEFSVKVMEEKLVHILSKVEGAGEVSVMLTVKSGTERVLAQNIEESADETVSETVVVNTGGSTEEVVLIQQISPRFQGALVVCEGGDDPKVKLMVTEAVAALTGLGTARIKVCKGV